MSDDDDGDDDGQSTKNYGKENKGNDNHKKDNHNKDDHNTATNITTMKLVILTYLWQENGFFCNWTIFMWLKLFSMFPDFLIFYFIKWN